MEKLSDCSVLGRDNPLFGEMGAGKCLMDIAGRDIVARHEMATLQGETSGCKTSCIARMGRHCAMRPHALQEEMGRDKYLGDFAACHETLCHEMQSLGSVMP